MTVQKLLFVKLFFLTRLVDNKSKMGPSYYESLDPLSDYENGPWAQLDFASHWHLPGLTIREIFPHLAL